MSKGKAGIFQTILHRILGTRAAGVYILLFAAAIGIATFVENDFGTSSAQKVIFKSWWFELLLILFGLSLIYNIIQFRMVKAKKWSLLTFHLSMIIILIGAGVTRYIGYEGMMHIREDDSNNNFLSAETYLKYKVQKGNKVYEFAEPVLFATLGNNNLKKSYQIGNDLIETEVIQFVPNPTQVLVPSDKGEPTLKIVIAGQSGREEYYISPGDKTNIRGINFNFGDDEIAGAINIKYENEELFIKSNRVLTQMVMATQQRDTLMPGNSYYPLRLRSLYSDGPNSFVFGDFRDRAILELQSEDPKVKNESLTALFMEVAINGKKETAYVFGKKGQMGRPVTFGNDGMRMDVSYGSKVIDLPFSIFLYDFIMEKYPGTNNPASYASEVRLIDVKNGVDEDHRIYMNHILNYGGYRFFQSSFDPDEKGTYLSVNHDFWGTWISYIGYALLTIGMIWLFMDRRTRFYDVSKKVNKLTKQTGVGLIFIISMLFSQFSYSQEVIAPQVNLVDAGHAEKFSNIIVQDHKGRMKPMHTLTREIMRKMARTESLMGKSADQIVLSMYADKRSWLDIPMIKTSKHEKILEQLGTSEKLAAYEDFFNTNGEYKFKDEIRRAYSLQPIDRGTYEKDLMKIDERVNIASMIFSGRFFKIIPVPDDPNNEWVSEYYNTGTQQRTIEVADKFFSAYQPALQDAMTSGDYSFVNQVLDELGKFQRVEGADIVPSKTKTNLEILLNELNVFNRLALIYGLLGIVFLVLLFISVFKPNKDLSKISKIFFYLAVAGFAFHTIGLGIRWYVSGRAPWSNGYESMIYIAWTTTLAGLIFTRKSLGGLAATMILAGTILLVAMLSYLDPEITPLVPVLRSYWLTIHVSLIAGSYGFLMLGAIIGLINLLLMIFLNNENKERIKHLVKEMSYISELTLTGGLVMLSIGTYLGGVWANESWGRYWGWDAKETCALVTILVYAFILHMRIIPKLYSLYSYNLATLFGWASVVMTYFGVNYYLSGLHSYAAGDPVPIPNWVYIAVVSVFIISVLAFWRKKKYNTM